MGKGYIEEIDSVSNKFLIFLCCCGSTFLFSPENLITKLGLNKVRDEFKGLIGAAVFVSVVYLLVRMFFYLGPLGLKLGKKFYQTTRIKKKLRSLNNCELNILKEIYDSHYKMTSLSVFDTTVNGMLKIGILEIASTYLVQSLPSIAIPYSEYISSQVYYVFSKDGLELYKKCIIDHK